jgi:hypothetical protein
MEGGNITIAGVSQERGVQWGETEHENVLVKKKCPFWDLNINFSSSNVCFLTKLVREVFSWAEEHPFGGSGQFHILMKEPVARLVSGKRQSS